MANCKYHEICGRDADGDTGDGCCILHSENPDKDIDTFRQALEERLKNERYDFVAFIFTEDVDFSNVSFDRGADFSDAVFHKGAKFTGAEFAEKASFVGAQFLDGVDFGQAKFLEFADFAGVVFKRMARFDDAAFMRGANFSPYDEQRGMFPITPFSGLTSFRGAQFTGAVDFSIRPFQGGAIFRESIFSGKADFSRTKFIQDAEFPGSRFSPDFSAVRFGDEADFSDVEFNTDIAFTAGKFAQANFSNTKFALEADFTDVEFEGDVNFEHSAFAKLANFMSAEFAGRADFSRSFFAEEARFSNATFSGRALFDLAGFGNVAHFAYTKFVNLNKRENLHDGSDIGRIKVSFWHATFDKRVDFEGAKFGEGADFSDAKFKEGADFSSALFGKRTSFSGSTFLGRTPFVSGEDEGQKSQIFPGAEIDFRRIITDPLDALIFRDANLKKCQFQGTDLRKAEITNATWPEKGGRFRVYDEDVQLPEGATRAWPHIERLYRELKQNYEERRDYERACDFHYGEKEMRRQNPETSWGLWLWLNLYKWVAGYGERYWRPLLWAVGLIVVSAALYLWLGLRPKTGDQTFLNITSPWDWFRSGFYSLRVMTLLKPEDLEPYRYAKLVHAFESLAGPILLGLFALALRQRLKR
jgi:uncharacterized protein YjbI with pentapeptide repeats